MPMRVLVTGATGFLGGMVTRELIRAGRHVRILVRPTADRRSVRDLPVEVAPGDVRDLDSLRRATAGCVQVYHVAALYKLWVRSRQEIYESNVAGTENVLRVARERGVEKVIY